MREVTREEMRALEMRADAAGLRYGEMMARAGRAAAGEALARVPSGRALVVCGKGNNGGDGFVIARLLREAGLAVHILLAQGEPATANAQENYRRACAMRLPCEALDAGNPAQQALARAADVCIDAVYGTGFRLPMPPDGEAAARLMALCGGLVLAVDVPSGVECDTGAAAPSAVRAGVTVAFHAPKPCHRLAKALCGEVAVRSIGIEQALGL